jgi:hypothetical protein
MQLACRWCCAMVEAADNNILAILKAVALLQLAAAHAKQLQGDRTGSTLHTDTPVHQTDGPAQASAASTDTRHLLQDLQPCVMLLTGVMSQAPVQALRSQAAVALEQVLQALPQPTSYACLQQLLSGGAPGGEIYPEVAALLLQEVRGLMASSTNTGGFGQCSFLRVWALRILSICLCSGKVVLPYAPGYVGIPQSRAVVCLSSVLQQAPASTPLAA